MDRSTDEGRIELERQWLNGEPSLKGNPDWWKFRCTSRTYLYHHRPMVVWDYIAGQPVIFDVLRVGEVGIGWQGGLTVILESAKSDRQYTVGALPRAEIPGVFLWIPAFGDVRFGQMNYSAAGSTRRLTIPLCYRTHHKDLRDGARYLSGLKEFKAAWPDVI